MNLLRRLETRFQELVFIALLMGTPVAAFGAWALPMLEAQGLQLWLGEGGSSFFAGLYHYFGFAAMLLPFFVGHYLVTMIERFEGPLAMIRSYDFHLFRYASYLFLGALLSIFLGVLEAYHAWEPVLASGVGGSVGQTLGHALFFWLGIYGAMSFLAALFIASLLFTGWLDIVAFSLATVRLSKLAVASVFGKIKKADKEVMSKKERLHKNVSQWDELQDTGSYASRPLPMKDLVRQVLEEEANLKQLNQIESDFEEEDNTDIVDTNKESAKKAPKKSQATKASLKAVDGQKPKTAKATKSKASLKKVEAEEEEEGEEVILAEDIKLEPYTKKYSSPSKTGLAGQSKIKIPGKKELTEKSRVIEERLLSFGVAGKVTKVHPGIRLTMFEFLPESGVKLSKISGLGSDLALLLGAASIRILAPIPGKNTVGIEVPNTETSILAFSGCLSEINKAKSKMNLPVLIGQDVSGKVKVADLSAMPHLLVSGTTGSGKSVFVNTLINSLLFTKSPKELRLIMVDPKMIELTPYNDIPHLAKPVICDVNESKDALVWAAKEMDRRYTIFSEMGARNLESFNEKLKKISKKRVEERLGRKIDWDWNHMPYVVVIVDELADLMITQGKEVEIPITRIAQKARAAGIHLVLCTQRPSSDIVTGLIKTNFPTRVSFKVSSGIDSRTILDQGGAEKLLGNGDMLYLPNGKSVERLQGAFLPESDVASVVSSIRVKKK